MKRTFVFVILVLIFTRGSAQWTDMNFGLTNRNVKAMVSIGTEIFTATFGGGVFRSSDNGGSWTPANTGLSNLYVNTLASVGSTVFAGTQGGGVFMTADNGVNWTAVNNGLPDLLIISLKSTGTKLFAGTNSSGLQMSTNNGLSWTSANTGFSNSPLPKISVIDTIGSNIFAGDGSMSNSCGVYISTNNGASWNQSNSGLFYVCVKAFAANGSTIFSGNIGSVYSSNNSGTSWVAANVGLQTGQYISAFAVRSNIIFAGQSNSKLFNSTDNGNTWNEISEDLPSGQYVNFLTIHGSNIFAGLTGMGISGIFRHSLLNYTTSIAEHEIESRFTIAPNPFNSAATITFSEDQIETAILIRDIVGREIKTVNFSGKSFSLEKSDFGQGVFFVEICARNRRVVSKKIIVD